ncbi:MAG: Stp1/IreP family PP2C-type Ser/Thr phosphatase, partial [Acidimicrobiales bacterium]
MTTKLSGAAATDVGRVRRMNEDRYLVGEGIYAVADGVGGHQAGEVAAQTAVEALAEHFTDRTPQGLVDAVLAANSAVWELAQENSERRGMGTTLISVALVEHEDDEHLAIANVGDSRAYLFQRGDLLQVSEDHSLVEELVREGQLTPAEAQVHPQRSIITRALGMEPEIEVDVWTLTPYAGDRILLCSDGLTNEIGVDRMAATLRQLLDPQEAARDLVRQARAHGGNDNITVVVVDVVEDGGRAEEASKQLGRADKKKPATPATP